MPSFPVLRRCQSLTFSSPPRTSHRSNGEGAPSSKCTLDVDTLRTRKDVVPKTPLALATSGVFSLALDGLARPAATKGRPALPAPLTAERRSYVYATVVPEAIDSAFSVFNLFYLKGVTLLERGAHAFCQKEPGDLGQLARRLCQIESSSTMAKASRALRFWWPLPPIVNLGRQCFRVTQFAQAYHWNVHAPSLWATRQELQCLKTEGDGEGQYQAAKDLALAYLGAGQAIPTWLVEEVAAALLAVDNYREARQWGEHAIGRQDTNRPQMHLLLAQTYIKEGLYGVARGLLLRRSSEELEDANVQLALAMTYLAQRDIENASRAYLRARKSSTELNEEALFGFDYCKLFRAGGVNLVPTAQQIIELALKTDAKVTLATHVLYRLCQYAAVEERLLMLEDRHANRFLPPTWRLKLAFCQFDQNKFTQAGYHFEKGLRHRPNHFATQNYLYSIKAKQQLSFLPPCEDLPWDDEEVGDGAQIQCMISMKSYAEIQQPVVLKKGNGRYYFEYSVLQAYHDRVLKDFFDNGPLRANDLFRVPATKKSLRGRLTAFALRSKSHPHE